MKDVTQTEGGRKVLWGLRTCGQPCGMLFHDLQMCLRACAISGHLWIALHKYSKVILFLLLCDTQSYLTAPVDNRISLRSLDPNHQGDPGSWPTLNTIDRPRSTHDTLSGPRSTHDTFGVIRLHMCDNSRKPDLVSLDCSGFGSQMWNVDNVITFHHDW